MKQNPQKGKRMAVNVREIAKKANVSAATVSRVLHQSEQVKPETRKKVEEAMRQLQVTAGELVRSARMDTRIVGILVPDLSNSFFSECILGIEEYAREAGLTTIICHTKESDQEEVRYLRMLKEMHVCGIIMTPTSDDNDYMNNEYLNLLIDMKIPVVLLDRDVKYSQLDGVFIDNEDNAMLKVDGSATVNPLYMICYTYNDSRLGATLEGYLKGYEDPRLDIWFAKSEVSGFKEYNGIRCGSMFNGNDYKVFSNLNVSSSTPIQFMNAAEVYFLRAEAALRKWNAGGDAETLYENGIATAFSQPLGATQAKAGDATAYMKRTTLPKGYVDPKNSSYSDSSTGQVSVNWADATNFDERLEKIITQKWIALFPDGQEAWSEFRRTGCPRVIRVARNNSGGRIDTKKQVARLPYPTNLSKDYPDLYQEAVNNAELLDGADNGGTKLWWDKRNDKPYQN